MDTEREMARQFAVEHGYKDVADEFAAWYIYQDVEADLLYSLFNFLADREEGAL